VHNKIGAEKYSLSKSVKKLVFVSPPVKAVHLSSAAYSIFISLEVSFCFLETAFL